MADNFDGHLQNDDEQVQFDSDSCNDIDIYEDDEVELILNTKWLKTDSTEESQ